MGGKCEVFNHAFILQTFSKQFHNKKDEVLSCGRQSFFIQIHDKLRFLFLPQGEENRQKKFKFG